MEVLCVLFEKNGRNNSNCACPFGFDERLSGKPCPWQKDNRCVYKANRKKKKKNLSLLTSRIFEMSRMKNFPAGSTTKICMMLDSARKLLDN